MATKWGKICQAIYCGRDGVKTEGCCLISIRVALAQQSARLQVLLRLQRDGSVRYW